MPTFLDKKNRTWAVDLAGDGLLRWRDTPGLPDPMDIEASIEMLFVNPLTTLQVVQALLVTQIAKAQITPTDFLAAMRGEHTAAACAVLLEEYQRFFVHPALAAEVTEQVAKQQAKQAQQLCGKPSGGQPEQPA